MRSGRKKRNILKRILSRTVTVLFLVVAVWGAIVVVEGYSMYSNALERQGLEECVYSIRSKTNYTELNKLPQMYLDAVIAVEDGRFYKHCGIDLFSIGRAFLLDLTTWSLKEGGSTLTQQLAKNLYFTQKKQLSRKVAEVFMALDIEAAYSKDEILELYVNSIYFGDGYYCVRDASMGYFGVEPLQMEAYECTMLAGVPNAPSLYSPSVNLELAKERQHIVIQRMVECGYITDKEAHMILY